MSSLRERIAEERGRLKSVRLLLSAALEDDSAQDGADRTGFYIAVGDYLEAAMERLHRQDVRMTALLEEKADLSTPEAQQAMSELAERLAGNQHYLDRYLEAKRALESDGTAAIEQYESAATDYTRYIVNNMGHHAGSVDLARAAFSAEDWADMAFVSDSEAELEQRLFDAVTAATPESLQTDR